MLRLVQAASPEEAERVYEPDVSDLQSGFHVQRRVVSGARMLHGVPRRHVALQPQPEERLRVEQERALKRRAPGLHDRARALDLGGKNVRRRGEVLEHDPAQLDRDALLVPLGPRLGGRVAELIDRPVEKGEGLLPTALDLAAVTGLAQETPAGEALLGRPILERALERLHRLVVAAPQLEDVPDRLPYPRPEVTPALVLRQRSQALERAVERLQRFLVQVRASRFLARAEQILGGASGVVGPFEVVCESLDVLLQPIRVQI